jgi:hypothetical protein
MFSKLHLDHKSIEMPAQELGALEAWLIQKRSKVRAGEVGSEQILCHHRQHAISSYFMVS